MQNPIPKSRQSSIISEEPGDLSEKLKTLTTIIEFNIFCWTFAPVLYLQMSTKGCSRIFVFLFKS